MKLVVWMTHIHIEQHAASLGVGLLFGEVVGIMWQQSCCFLQSLEPLSLAIEFRGQLVGLGTWPSGGGSPSVSRAVWHAQGSWLCSYCASSLPSQEERQVSCPNSKAVCSSTVGRHQLWVLLVPGILVSQLHKLVTEHPNSHQHRWF